jgi:hypothetical protein
VTASFVPFRGLLLSFVILLNARPGSNQPGVIFLMQLQARGRSRDVPLQKIAVTHDDVRQIGKLFLDGEKMIPTHCQDQIASRCPEDDERPTIIERAGQRKEGIFRLRQFVAIAGLDLGLDLTFEILDLAVPDFATAELAAGGFGLSLRHCFRSL